MFRKHTKGHLYPNLSTHRTNNRKHNYKQGLGRKWERNVLFQISREKESWQKRSLSPYCQRLWQENCMSHPVPTPWKMSSHCMTIKGQGMPYLYSAHKIVLALHVKRTSLCGGRTIKSGGKITLSKITKMWVEVWLGNFLPV